MIPSIEYFPLIATAGGAAIGAGLDVLAQRRLEAERQAFTEVHDPENLGLTSQLGNWQRVGRTMLGSLVIYSGAAGYINGLAWKPEAPAESIPPSIELVIDHSGATTLGNKPAIDSINAIVHEISESDLTSHAIVARLGDIRGMNTEDVAEDKPFGDAPLTQGVQSALDTISTQRAQAIGSEQEPNRGIVAITNGNGIGDPATITRRATDTGTHISIVNVESSVQDPAIEAQLKDIAKTTGGQYWSIDAVSGTKVAQEAAKDLVRQQTPNNAEGDTWKERLIGLAFAAGTIRVYKNRRREPLNSGFKISRRKK